MEFSEGGGSSINDDAKTRGVEGESKTHQVNNESTFNQSTTTSTSMSDKINVQDGGALDKQLEVNVSANTGNDRPKTLSDKPTLVVLPVKIPDIQPTFDWRKRKTSLLEWQDDVKYHIKIS